MSLRPHISVPARAVSHGTARDGTRTLAQEVPVALSYNGTTQAVMMASPADLADFAYGFSLTEEIARPEDIQRLDVVEHPKGLECRMWLAPEAEARLTRRRRHMAGPVGCGLCGIDSLDEALRPLPRLPESSTPFHPAQITAAMTRLRDGQPLHDLTRSVHAAGFLSAAGGLTIREDVGRHNALDKLIGALRGTCDGAALLTSRVSVEMVQKTVLAGIPLLVAVSAPTACAVELAQDAGLTVAALARGDTFEIFTHPHRIQTGKASDVA